jgi:hypothetical protein
VEKIVLGSVIYEKKNTQKLNKEQFSNKFSDKNENEFFLGVHKKIPALWTRASESGHLVQMFDSVSVIWSLFNIFN